MNVYLPLVRMVVLVWMELQNIIVGAKQGILGLIVRQVCHDIGLIS